VSEAKAVFVTDRLRFWTEQGPDERFHATINHIREHGWSAMLIRPCRHGLGFCYSVGAHDTLNVREIIVVGLKQQTAHRALQHAIDAMEAGTDLTVGRHREIVGEVEVEFRPVSERWYRHVMCRDEWYYMNQVVPALQLIYPDLEGRFQWEEGFQEYFRQPLLQEDAAETESERSFWKSNDPESEFFDWSFADDPHTTSYLSKTVSEGEEPVTYVSHDSDDGAWQFLGDKMTDGGGPVLSCLHHPIDKDSTLRALHDLPRGWYAVRDHVGAPWERFEHEPEDEEQPAAPGSAANDRC
jgi:hypothetical protein